MPVAGVEIIKEIQLNTEGAYVKVLTNPKASAVQEMKKTGNDATFENDFLAYVIKEWNFTDKDGNPLPINAENIGLALSLQDSAIISLTLGLDKLKLSDAKKNS